MGTSSRVANPVRKHKRDVWLKIIAPVALPFVGLVVLSTILALSVGNGTLASKQITTVMSLMAVCFLALPAVLLCVVPYLALAAVAALAGKGYAHAQTPLRQARRTTEKVAVKTNEIVPRLAEPVLALNVRLTRWENTVSSWLQLDSEKDESHG